MQFKSFNAGLAAFFFSALLCCTLAMAQETATDGSQAGQPSGGANDGQAARQASGDAAGPADAHQHMDKTLFFAYLDDDREQRSGPLFEFFHNKPVLREFLMPSPEDSKYRPMLQWRFWANLPQRFVPATAFCAFIAWTVWVVLPEKLSKAENLCRQEFWRCFLVGCLTGAVCLLFARTMFVTHVGWPCGIAVVAAFQLLLLSGLSVTVSLVGHAVSVLLRLSSLSFLAKHPSVLRVMELLVGAVVLALLLQVPSPAELPRIGTRLVALFALLGAGGIVRILRSI